MALSRPPRRQTPPQWVGADEFIYLRPFECAVYGFLARLRVARSNIVEDCSFEQVRVLEHDAHPSAAFCLALLPDVCVPDHHPARAWFV